MGFDCGNCLTCLGVEAHDEAPVCSYGKESAQMTDSESNETLLTHWEGLIDVPEQVWRWVATLGIW